MRARHRTTLKHANSPLYKRHLSPGPTSCIHWAPTHPHTKPTHRRPIRAARFAVEAKGWIAVKGSVCCVEHDYTWMFWTVEFSVGDFMDS